MEQPFVLEQESESLALAAIGESFSRLRIVDPAAERGMVNSLAKYGQLTPVVVCRLAPGEVELLDGFKRLRAARQLELPVLRVRYLPVGLRAGKAAMLQLNRVGRNISAMEEALVVHSLCHEDGLSQVEAAVLLGRHKSWVSRRVALVARLADEARERIKLGLLPASLGSELARGERCNQQRVLAVIGREHLTWRETRKLISLLLSQPNNNYEQLLRDPRSAIYGEGEVWPAPAEEQGLPGEARDLLHRLLAFEKNCLSLALRLSSSELESFEPAATQRLQGACGRALVSLARAEAELRAKQGKGAAHGHGDPGTG